MITKLTPEDFAIINRQLKENYGNTEDKAHFRLVWSEDEKQTRITKFTPEGLELLYPEAREMRKYPDIRNRYVLETLIVLPKFKEHDIVNETLSYTAIWTFEIIDANREKMFVAPNYGACKYVVEVVLENTRTGGVYTKYKDPESDPEDAKAIKRAEIDNLERELYGDSSAITDSLALRKGVAYGQGSSPNSSTPRTKSE